MTNYFYAVARGKQIGIFNSWNEIKPLIYNFKNAKYKKFTNREEAEHFINQNSYKQSHIDNFVKIEENEEFIPIEKNNIIIFTDGSSKNNSTHNKKASASYAIVFPYHENYNYSSLLENNEPQTNNRAEFKAVINAIKIADNIDEYRIKVLDIYTDSQLLINTATNWVHKWKLNDWENGKDKKNLDLVKELYNLMQIRQVNLHYIQAHTNKTDWFSKYNDMVDKLAQSISTK